MIQSRAKYSILIQEKRQSIKSNRLAKNVLVLACNKAQINLQKFPSRQLSLSVAFASNTLVSLHYSLLLNNTKSGYFTSNLPFSLHSVAGALEQSLDGRELSTSAAARIKGTANTHRNSALRLANVLTATHSKGKKAITLCRLFKTIMCIKLYGSLF